MTTMVLSVGEPFTSPAWGSNFVIFSSETGEAVPEERTEGYLARACKYARHYEVYLVPDRFFLKGYHCMCLIAPDGGVMSAGKAAFQNLDHRFGKRGTNVDVISTEFGGIYLCVDVDIYHPELPRIAHGSGAQFIICSQRIYKGDYDTGMVVSGVWSASQGSPVYTVGVSNQFNCVCAPRAMTAHDDGFIVAPSLKMPLTAKLSSEGLQSLPRRSCLSRRLYALHRGDLED